MGYTAVHRPLPGVPLHHGGSGHVCRPWSDGPPHSGQPVHDAPDPQLPDRHHGNQGRSH